MGFQDDQKHSFSNNHRQNLTLLEKFLGILLNVTDDAIANLYVTKSLVIYIYKEMVENLAT